MLPETCAVAAGNHSGTPLQQQQLLLVVMSNKLPGGCFYEDLEDMQGV